MESVNDQQQQQEVMSARAVAWRELVPSINMFISVWHVRKGQFGYVLHMDSFHFHLVTRVNTRAIHPRQG